MKISFRLVPSAQCDTCGDLIENAHYLYKHCDSIYCEKCAMTETNGAQCPVCGTWLDSLADKMIDAANIDLYAMQED